MCAWSQTSLPEKAGITVTAVWAWGTWGASLGLGGFAARSDSIIWRLRLLRTVPDPWCSAPVALLGSEEALGSPLPQLPLGSLGRCLETEDTFIGLRRPRSRDAATRGSCLLGRQMWNCQGGQGRAWGGLGTLVTRWCGVACWVGGYTAASETGLEEPNGILDLGQGLELRV